MPLSAMRYKWDKLYGLKFALFLFFLWAVLFNMSGCTATNKINEANTDPINLPLLEKWSGDYPVAELGRMPAGQQDTAAGYFGDREMFLPVWQAFMPEEAPPTVDFSKNIIVFSRNVQFYNRTNIFKVELRDGTAEILAMETMSALPIEEKVAMAMAVVPREGVKAIRSGSENIKVMDFK